MVRLEIDRLKSTAVIPAKAGIYVLRSSNLVSVDPRLRGDDGKRVINCHLLWPNWHPKNYTEQSRTQTGMTETKT